MRYVYIAGPYTSGPLDEHIARVVDAAELLRAAGLVPFIPHTMTFLWAVRYQHDKAYWMSYDDDWLQRCDALLRVPGASRGADQEVELARKLGLPVFFSATDLLEAIPTEVVR